MEDRPQWYINKIERNKEYAKDYRRVILSLNYDGEADIIEYLESKKSKQAYVKDLIAEDMRAKQRKRTLNLKED